MFLTKQNRKLRKKKIKPLDRLKGCEKIQIRNAEIVFIYTAFFFMLELKHFQKTDVISSGTSICGQGQLFNFGWEYG